MTLAVFATGCYTQVAAEREDRYDNPEYGYTDSQPGYDSTVADSDRYAEEPYETVRHRAYFDYYYPSFSVGLGWYSPWYWGFGYDPFFYSSYYPWYYSSWGYPVVSPYPWYVYPGYRDPGYYGPYYSHRYGTTRTFGRTRTAGVNRGGAADFRGGRASSLTNPARSGYVPRGVSRATAPRQPRVSTGRHRIESGRSATAPRTRSYQGKPERGSSRDSYRSEPPRQRYESPRSGGTINRGGGERSSGGRSYSPPSSSSGRGGSAPAPSGNRGSSGSRGGNRR